MARLSDWIHLTQDDNVETLAGLTRPATPTCGHYDHIVNAFSLLDKLDQAFVDTPHPQDRPMVLELRDVDIGTPSKVSGKALADLVATHKLDPQTPVHLRGVFGGLSLFILIDDVAACPIKTNLTSLAIDPQTKVLWGATLGKFLQSNPVWGQQRFDGRTSTLERTLKVPYLCTYTLINQANFTDGFEDLPC